MIENHNLRNQMLAIFGVPVAAIINGIIREKTYATRMSEDAAHGLSTIPLLSVVLGYARVLDRVWPLESWRQAIAVGAFWAAFAVTFETVSGRARGMSWSSLFHDYNIAAGRLWGLVPLVLLVAPLLVRRRTNESRSDPLEA